jgi:uracil-DNA glycosylase|tara:strand:- start:13334 stop:14422 length:1089 start_codon:yes stop_codon:yes gene_type:complete
MTKQTVPSQQPSNGQSMIAFVFDFPSTDEQRLGQIMVGSTGKMFHKMCEILNLNVENCLLTYALSQKPAQENPAHFFNNKNSYKALLKEGKSRSKFPVNGFGFLKEEYEGEIDRLETELNACKPNVIIAMGSIALWALTGLDKIGTYRGTVLKSNLTGGTKVLPTFSPSAVIRNFDFRPVVLSDIKKAIAESETPDIQIKERELWIEPTIEDLNKFEEQYIREDNEASPLSFDIETSGGFITCIGFAPSDSVALVIPFKDTRNALQNYWKDNKHEQQAWAWVKRILENEKITKVAQNQTYDVSWLSYKQNINVKGKIHDTMHAQHALQPEQQKGLGFLGSIYTNEGAWKTMAKFSKSTKRDE